MPSLTNILRRAPHLTSVDREWLHLLVGDWQIISDLSFSDLLLLVPDDSGSFTIVAQCRPATAATLFDDDVVGRDATPDQQYLAAAVWKSERARGEDWDTVRVDMYPVRREERTIAVLAVTGALMPDRVPAQFQSNYGDIAESLLRMVTTSEYPFDGSPTGYRHGTPRVVDGFIRLDAEGSVVYGSPNANSNFHSIGVLGSLAGQVLAEVVPDLIENHSTVDESLPVVLMGKAPWMCELEVHGVILSLRAVPLLEHGTRLGAILLCRDISELRHREQELITKDATIREINHRVKNNLQTVSALLRMQSRRASNEETKQALEDAQRRVATIALVHQTLSQTIDEHVIFDDVFAPLLRMSTDIAATGVVVASRLRGSFGRIGANQTTALAVILNELVTNAIEHGLPEGGHLTVTARREDDFLSVDVEDDGVSVNPRDVGRGSGLGTKVVRTLVEGELRGSINWLPRAGGGTRVHIEAEIDQ